MTSLMESAPEKRFCAQTANLLYPLNAICPLGKWSMSRLTSALSSSSERNAISPSATITAGRLLGTASSQVGLVKSAPMSKTVASSGSSCRRGDDLRKIDVVPVDGRRSCDPEHAAVQARA